MKLSEFLKDEYGGNVLLTYLRRRRAGDAATAPSTSALTLEDGTTPLHLEDGVTELTLEG